MPEIQDVVFPADSEVDCSMDRQAHYFPKSSIGISPAATAVLNPGKKLGVYWSGGWHLVCVGYFHHRFWMSMLRISLYPEDLWKRPWTEEKSLLSSSCLPRGQFTRSSSCVILCQYMCSLLLVCTSVVPGFSNVLWVYSSSFKWIHVFKYML